MSKLRKSLKKTYSVFIKPSDEAIDWKATAKKATEDEVYFTTLKEIAFPDDEMEDVKNKFISNANKMTIYDYYVYRKFDSDVIVSSTETPVLQYVFEDFNLTDLDILFSQIDGLKMLFSSLKVQDLSASNTVETLIGLLEKPEIKDKIFDFIKVVLSAKLVKCLGVDTGITKEEIVEETINELKTQDIKMLIKFVQQSLKLDVEKKNILES